MAWTKENNKKRIKNISLFLSGWPLTVLVFLFFYFFFYILFIIIIVPANENIVDIAWLEWRGMRETT